MLVALEAATMNDRCTTLSGLAPFPTLLPHSSEKLIKCSWCRVHGQTPSLQLQQGLGNQCNRNTGVLATALFQSVFKPISFLYEMCTRWGLISQHNARHREKRRSLAERCFCFFSWMPVIPVMIVTVLWFDLFANFGHCGSIRRKPLGRTCTFRQIPFFFLFFKTFYYHFCNKFTCSNNI